MTEPTVSAYLIDRLDKQIAIISESILKGDLADAEYRRLSGILSGLRYARDLINDTADRLANDEELQNDE